MWQPGTEHLYHPFTFGSLVGEVVRRISGKSLGTFFAAEVAAPLGLSAWIGLPEEQEERVARIEHAPREPSELVAGLVQRSGLDAETVTRWVEAVWGPGSVFARSALVDGPPDLVNDRAYRAAEIPAGNMVTDARSLARMYAATVSDVDGIRLLEPATVEKMTVVQTNTTTMHGLPPGVTLPADRSFYMSLGFWRHCPGLRMVGPASFGHPGSGGSIGFADPDHGVGFGYVPNRWLQSPAEPRATNLTEAVVACLS